MPSPHSEFLELATKLKNEVEPTSDPEDLMVLTALAFAVDLTNSLDRIAVTMSKMTQELSRIQARL